MLFLSHSSRDKDAVRRLVDDLESAPFDVWFDGELRGGDEWWAEILRRIRECQVFIFALSENSRASRACQAEVAYARQLGIPVVPVQIAEVEGVRSSAIADLQVEPYIEPDVRAAFALARKIRALAEQPRRMPEQTPEPPPVPYAYLMRLGEQIDARDLSPAAQADLVRQLRDALETETDESVRDDLRNLLRSLRRRRDVLTERNGKEIDALLADSASTSLQSTSGAGPSTSISQPTRHGFSPAAGSGAAGATVTASWTDDAETGPGSDGVPPGMTSQEVPPAGWYPDGAGGRRYWDGQRWTVREPGWPPVTSGPGTPVNPTNTLSVLGIVLSVVLCGFPGVILAWIAKTRRESLSTVALVVSGAMSLLWLTFIIIVELNGGGTVSTP
jgi:hypothetical protein